VIDLTAIVATSNIAKLSKCLAMLLFFGAMIDVHQDLMAHSAGTIAAVSISSTGDPGTAPE
jgi:hypothetical protein